MGVSKIFLRPCPLERWKTPLLENTCLFLLNCNKQSGSDININFLYSHKISIAIKIDKISLRVTKHQANQVRKYIISLNKI